MDVESSQQIIDDVSLEQNSPYLVLHFDLTEYQLNEEKILAYFKKYIGNRFWFRSRENKFNMIGIQYIDGFHRNHFNSETLEVEKQKVFSKLQHIRLSDCLQGEICLFGGMHFDDKSTTDEWIDFPMVEFQLARWQFDLKNNEGFYIVEKENLETESLAKYINNILKEIEDTNISVKFPDIASEHEIYPNEWKQLVDDTIKELDENFKKVVLSRELLVRFEEQIDPDFLIKRLNDETDTFTILYEKGQSTFLSKSPEKLFDLTDKHLTTNAIAGSIRREKDVNANEDNKSKFLQDKKNLFEHNIVRDSIVEHLEPYARGVRYKTTPKILENRYIYHLYTPIEADLKEDSNLFQVLYELHPTPAVGGLPKDRAMEYIKEKEYYTRGLYAAPLGIITENNNAEFVVSLRSMLIKGKSATLYAGAGIVKGSNSESEYEETKTKFRPMLNVLEALE